MQKRASSGAGSPHEGQRRSRVEPQDMQKRAEAGFSAPQEPQALMGAAPRRLLAAGGLFEH